jgi:hypothetical protein
MNNIYTITKTASDVSSHEVFSTRTFKGDTSIELDFSSIVENEIKLVKIQIDFGDGTSLEKVYSNNVNLLENITHNYFPSETSYIITRRCNISLIFSNFTIHNVVFTFNIAQNSFLSEYGALKVKRAQFIDNDNIGDMFLVLESEKHNLYNVSLKLDKITTTYTSTTAVDDLLITEDEDLFNTNFNDNIKVTVS